ncbi:MAG TPA: CDP-glucose 4,6-dehydratase, partial [Terriglobia bacterium]|nr:CDP-glucose 4,6-dehydratase [Terriglobia bacterium]
MNPAFWRGKRVLITGHTGFKGSWLSLWLQSMGANVVAYALAPPTNPNMFTLASVAKGISSIVGDIRDIEHLRKVVGSAKPEIVFHLAAQPLVRESYKDPVTTYAANVMGTVHLLECVRLVGTARAVVCITSDKCYENREWVWGYRENEAMGGYDPYSSSKGCAEIVAAAYRNSFFNPNRFPEHGTAIATVRAGNVIGGGDWAKDRLVPDILQSLVNGEPVILRNPQAIRPWQHVLEPLSGYLTLAERLYEDGPSYGEGWNFGPFDSGIQPVSWVVDQLVSLWGSDLSWKQDEAYQPHEDRYLMLDCAKARHRLGWEPVLEIKTALRWTVEWMKALKAGADMRRVSQSQISRFMELAQDQEMSHASAWLAGFNGQSTDLQPDQTHIFDHVDQTVIARRRDGLIAFWNRGAEKMYGWTKDEAQGQISHDLLQTQFPKSLESIEADLMEAGIWEGKLVHARRDGTQIQVQSRWVLQTQEPSPDETVFEINKLYPILLAIFFLA